MPDKDAQQQTIAGQKTEVWQRPRRRRSLKVDENAEVPEASFDWMDRTLQWGTRVRPGKAGLRIGDLNVGIYGEIPEYWEDQTRLPRGAYPTGGIPPIAIAVRSKRGMWADNAPDLYEEAIQRRWVPATDIPWDTIEPLPDDVEAAMCQLCTELSQAANVELETIGYWLQHLSFGYYEVKLFLATTMFDAGRHHEVFRKRALSNGGGLGLESKGLINRMILESRGGWSETSLLLHLLRGTFILTVYRYGERFAHNPAEKALFALATQDKARHVAYGLQHLRFAISQEQDKAQVFRNLLNIGEGVFVRELEQPALLEPLAIIYGGGIEGARAGMRRVRGMLADWLRYYLSAADWIGAPRGPAFSKDLAQYLED